jgi:hypothetical protein
MTQVRLDPDVADALQRIAARVGSGSVALHANRKLRQVLGLPQPGGQPATPGDQFAKARVGSAAGRPIGSAAQAKRAQGHLRRAMGR